MTFVSPRTHLAFDRPAPPNNQVRELARRGTSFPVESFEAAWNARRAQLYAEFQERRAAAVARAHERITARMEALAE